jgi:glyoxylase-like metal-dependent hydrolase (beta-lactamase superfamily II)
LALRTDVVDKRCSVSFVNPLEGGIKQITLPLPMRPGHVHAYLLPGEGGWTLVDTGVGLPDAKELWQLELERAGGRVARIFVTHFHPDHVGAAADVHELTGAPVVQGTPTVGLWPASRADPLGDYLTALEHTIELQPRVALPGHGDVIDDPAARARELQEHHRVRLEETVSAALDSEEPRTGYHLSLTLFGDDLKPAARRFAVAETLSHVERLVREGVAVRSEISGTVTYTAT